MQNIGIVFGQLLLTENFQKVGVEFSFSLKGQTWAWGTGAYLEAKLLVFISADTCTCWH